MGRARAANDPSVRVSLTPRHEEVLELIARGKTNGEIAQELGISLDGAKFHVREILSRMGVDSREEAAEAWRRRKRGLQWRMPAWISWPVAVGFGGLAGAAGMFVVALFAWVLPALSGDDGPKSQPELTAAYMGDGWQMQIDDAGGLPHARDSVLAVEWDTESPEVMLVEASTGRIAARWNVAYAPMAVLRPEANQVLISDMVHPDDEARAAHRLLIFDLGEEPGHVATVQTEARSNYLIFANGLQLSANDRYLFYYGTSYPDCFEELPNGTRIARNCEQTRVGIVDLDDASSGAILADVGDNCALRPVRDGSAAVQAICDDQTYIVRVDGSVEPGASDPNWWPYGSSTLLTPGLTFRTERYRGACCSVRYAGIFRAETGAEVERHHFERDEVRSVVLTGPGEALLLAGDGTFHRFDLKSGDRDLLPYRLPPDVEISAVELVR